jgi:outer membrane protein TolC
VAAAERHVAAANAQIGVTRAAWFPIFTLNAAFGYASTNSSNWLSAPSHFWSIGPDALLTLFDGGRRRALNEQANAAYDESVANYRQTVLVAYGEVENQLAAIRWIDAQRQSQARAVESSTHTLEQANYRYRGGIATYLEVTTAQTTNLQAQQADLNLRVQRMNASVALIKALGGDWRGENYAANGTGPVAVVRDGSKE